MINVDLNPKTKTDLSSRSLSWVVRLEPQVYTFEEVFGDLEEEISAARSGNKIETGQIPSLAPEDFEAVYHWFIS